MGLMCFPGCLSGAIFHERCQLKLIGNEKAKKSFVTSLSSSSPKSSNSTQKHSNWFKLQISLPKTPIMSINSTHFNNKYLITQKSVKPTSIHNIDCITPSEKEIFFSFTSFLHTFFANKKKFQKFLFFFSSRWLKMSCVTVWLSFEYYSKLEFLHSFFSLPSSLAYYKKFSASFAELYRLTAFENLSTVSSTLMRSIKRWNINRCLDETCSRPFEKITKCAHHSRLKNKNSLSLSKVPFVPIGRYYDYSELVIWMEKSKPTWDCAANFSCISAATVCDSKRIEWMNHKVTTLHYPLAYDSSDSTGLHNKAYLTNLSCGFPEKKLSLPWGCIE